MFRILTIVLLYGLSVNYIWAKNLSKVESYRLYLSKLNKSDPDSIGKSVKEFHRLYSKKNDQKSQDASVDDWWEFNSKTLDRLNEAEALGKISGLFDGTINNDDLYQALDKGKIKDRDKEFEKAYGRKTTDFLERLYENGMTIYSTEGTPYVDYDPDYVDRSFSPYLSPAEKEYTRLRMREFKEEFSDDAILRVPWDEVRQRIVAWDGYLKKFPESARKDEIEGEMKEYIEVYLSGMDNSPTCDEGKGPNGSSVLNAELKKSYETFLTKNKSCQYYPIVSKYYQSLKTHGFNCGEVNVGFVLSEYGLSPAHACRKKDSVQLCTSRTPPPENSNRSNRQSTLIPFNR